MMPSFLSSSLTFGLTFSELYLYFDPSPCLISSTIHYLPYNTFPIHHHPTSDSFSLSWCFFQLEVVHLERYLLVGWLRKRTRRSFSWKQVETQPMTRISTSRSSQTVSEVQSSTGSTELYHRKTPAKDT